MIYYTNIVVNLVQYLSSFVILIVQYSLLYCILTALVICCFNVLRFLTINFGERVKADGSKGILITGATSGFGLLMAKHFYKLGFSVFACYYNDREAGFDELLGLSKAEDTKTKLFLVRMDVSSLESIKQAHQEVEKILDKHNMELYCIVNNAGISKVGPFEWADQQSITQSISTNLTGALLVTRQFILRIIQSKGRVVNVSSGMQAFPNTGGLTVYGSTKTALRHFSDSLHEDLVNYGASCHCVLPGNFITVSNIIYSRIKCLQDSENKLTDLERAVYKESIDLHFRAMYKLLKIKLNKSNDDPDKIASIFQIDIPKFGTRKKTHKPVQLGILQKTIVKLMEYFDGGAEDLESSGCIDGFEHAICLKSPPRNLYSGNFLYTHVAGPISEHLSPTVCRIIAKLIIGGVIR